MQVKDWIQLITVLLALAAGVGSINYRLNSLEARFTNFEANFARKETVTAQFAAENARIKALEDKVHDYHPTHG